MPGRLKNPDLSLSSRNIISEQQFGDDPVFDYVGQCLYVWSQFIHFSLPKDS